MSAHNNKPHAALYTAPSQVQGRAGGDNPAMFRVMQDNASEFVHNRAVTQRRMGAIMEAGAFRLTFFRDRLRTGTLFFDIFVITGNRSATSV